MQVEFIAVNKRGGGGAGQSGTFSIEFTLKERTEGVLLISGTSRATTERGGRSLREVTVKITTSSGRQKEIGELKAWSTDMFEHVMLVGHLSLRLRKGKHKLTVETAKGTTIDANDYWNISYMYNVRAESAPELEGELAPFEIL